MEKEKLIFLNKRKIIYNFILENPGFHLREIQRKINMPYTTLRYHINFLKKRDLIIIKKEKGHYRYFVSYKIGNGDKEIFKIIRDKQLIKILIVFISCENKQILFKEDLQKLPDPISKLGWYDTWNFIIFKHRTTIVYYLKKLVDVGILETFKVGKKTGYKLRDFNKILDFLIRYNKEIDDKYINDLLTWSDNEDIPDRIDDTLEKIYDIFPHPYHV